MNPEGPGFDITKTLSTLLLLLLLERDVLEGLEMIKTTKKLIVKITNFLDSVGGIGDSGLGPFPTL